MNRKVDPYHGETILINEMMGILCDFLKVGLTFCKPNG